MVIASVINAITYNCNTRVFVISALLSVLYVFVSVFSYIYLIVKIILIRICFFFVSCFLFLFINFSFLFGVNIFSNPHDATKML